MTETMTTAQLVEAWIEADKKLTEVKALEIFLRKQLAPIVLNGKLEGTVTGIIEGRELKAVAKLNYRIDKNLYNEHRQELTAEDKLALRFKPELALGVYKKLPDTSILKDKLVTAKPGTPSLTLVTED